ncbi:MAG: hypothetical protein LCH38_07305 [Proteobacteria bacterium]|nr:hypothetical protein [Pseudomonadota bacterium]
MRINWSRREGAAPGSEAGGVMPGEAVRHEHVARQVGILACAIALGTLLVLLPARGSAATFSELPALAGLLAANVAGFLFTRARLAGASALFSALAIPFLLLSRMPWACGVILAGFALGEMLILRRGGARFAPAIMVSSAALVAGGLLLSEGRLGVVLFALAAWAPLASLALGAARSPARMTDSSLIERENRQLRALLAASTQQDDTRGVFVVDVAGRPDVMADLMPQRLIRLRAEETLVDAILIADRVAVLRAISDALYEQRAVSGLPVRIRREQSGAGYPYPPRFDDALCDIRPAEGLFGKVIVMIRMSTHAGALEPRGGGRSDAALAGLLHDCTAPFNAGLGFLEMIADPRLAPRDIATYREFAAEAAKAVGEAHRNAILLAGWLRLLEGGPGESVRCEPRRLVQDALRMLNLREACERGEIGIAEAGTGEEGRFPLMQACLAVGALLRFGRGAESCTLAWRRSGEDMILSCRRGGGDAPAALDAMQQALEARIGQGGTCLFGSENAGERHVRLVAAYTASEPRVGVVDGNDSRDGAIRLAS